MELSRTALPRTALPRMALPRMELPRMELPRTAFPRMELPRMAPPRIKSARVNCLIGGALSLPFLYTNLVHKKFVLKTYDRIAVHIWSKPSAYVIHPTVHRSISKQLCVVVPYFTQFCMVPHQILYPLDPMYFVLHFSTRPHSCKITTTIHISEKASLY